MTSEPISSMSELLSSMEPELDLDKYVYCTVPAELPRRLGTKATCSFRESEGETLILRSAEAEKHHLALQKDHSSRTLQFGSDRISSRHRW